MKLVTRQWLLGALVPSLGTLAIAVGAGQVLRFKLESSLEHALLTQDAVESVSLFDGPDEPENAESDIHLHLAISPLEREVRPFAPSAAIFRADGSVVVQFPNDGVFTGVRVIPTSAAARPQVSTRAMENGEHRREVTSSLTSQDGKLYALRISASLAPIDHTMLLFWRSTLGGSLLFGLLLVFIQGWHARRLTARLATLSRHVAAVREGRLGEELPVDSTGDEIAALRDMLADATTRLREARTSQERLIADAAHELRTPLTIMRTGIDLALRRRREAPELREALEEIRNEVDRLGALASRLLDLAVEGQMSLDRAAADLKPIVMESVDGALPSAEARGLSVELDLPDAAMAFIHGPSVRQAVDNLLSNAIKYAPPGSVIRVELRAVGEAWVVSVQDPGPGIPREHREAVFAPFHRVPGSLPGAGLGLAIVQEVARRHGGRAYVGDEAQGTRVVLEIAAA